MKSWLALMIGNSRLHWAWFTGSTLKQAWDIPHLAPADIDRLVHSQSGLPLLAQIPDATLAGEARSLSLPLTLQPPLPLWIASVIPDQVPLWQAYPASQVITLNQVELSGMYPTLGIDRALALRGALERLGSPALVVDAGTALTFTGADRQGCLVGGAILPGLQVQLRSLAQQTAALPSLEFHASSALPPRWAINTPDAICSGVMYTLLATLRDFLETWLAQFPKSAIGFTGGDSALLLNYLQQQCPDLAAQVTLDPHLIFWGMQAVVEGDRGLSG